MRNADRLQPVTTWKRFLEHSLRGTFTALQTVAGTITAIRSLIEHYPRTVSASAKSKGIVVMETKDQQKPTQLSGPPRTKPVVFCHSEQETIQKGIQFAFQRHFLEGGSGIINDTPFLVF